MEAIRDRGRATALLRHPLRMRILEHAREPVSATEIAARLDQPRQRVNYHVRELARARLLKRAGNARRGNMVAKKYVATAEAYVLAPEVLGALATGHADTDHDSFSAAHLIAATTRSAAEVARASREAEAQGKRLPTLSITSEIRFSSAAQRRQFTEALEQALTDLVAEHTTSGGRGRPYRLTMACHPIPPEEKP